MRAGEAAVEDVMAGLDLAWAVANGSSAQRSEQQTAGASSCEV
jgi:hypothetical protein